MRRVLFCFLTLTLCIKAANAQWHVSIPQPIKDTFAKAYPTAKNAKWERDNGQFEVSFKYKDQKMSVTYTAKGALLEKEIIIAVNELPEKALKYARAKGTITEAAHIIKADGMAFYEIEIKHKSLLFDDEGNFITDKTEKD